MEWPNISRARLAIGLVLVIAASLVVINMISPPGKSTEQSNMTRLENTEWAQNYEVFPEDLEEIQRLWNAPLTEDFMFIGGPDWPAWGHFKVMPLDGGSVVTGEVRDRSHWYTGPYQPVGAQGVPVSTDVLADFEVTGLDGARVILHRRNQPPPVDVIYLEPTNPEDIRKPPR